MKLALLGATGSVGRTLVMQALDADHEVTALVREGRSRARSTIASRSSSAT